MFPGPLERPADPRADPEVKLPISFDDAAVLQRREKRVARSSRFVLWMYTLFLLLVTAGFALVTELLALPEPPIDTSGEQR